MYYSLGWDWVILELREWIVIMKIAKVSIVIMNKWTWTMTVEWEIELKWIELNWIELQYNC